MMSDELEKSEGGRKVEEEGKKYRRTTNKNSYFGKIISDSLQKYWVKCRLECRLD